MYTIPLNWCGLAAGLISLALEAAPRTEPRGETMDPK